MELKKIYFDAFKSLLNKELEINHDCIGFVGTNESGKSNVLYAINVLSGNRKLSEADTPKMVKESNPSLRFLFKLSTKESKELTDIISVWREKNTIITNKSINSANLSIIYNVVFDKKKNKEERTFTIDGLKIENDSSVLLLSKLNDSYKIKNGDSFLALSKAIIIKDSILSADEKHREIYKEIEKIDIQISSDVNEIAHINGKITNLFKVPEQTVPAPQNGTSAEQVNPELISLNKNGENKIQEEAYKTDILKKEKSIEALKNRKIDLGLKIKDFDLRSLVDETNKNITISEAEIINLEQEVQKISLNKSLIEALPIPTEEQKNELKTITESATVLKNKMNEIKNRKIASEKRLLELIEPLRKKYTTDILELNKHLDSVVKPFLNNILPKVVFWEYSSKYILPSDTLFSDLLSKENLNDISRPLVNVFRIGLKVKTLEDLKSKIQEIQNNPSERSRLGKTLNKKINEFIKSVWQDYDQSINIALESERIRIEIYDPKREEEASHYNMDERSQGCQTFLSFLMTIGAEAEHGVLTNHILLLDEPETHLHPSGVRFMLQELIKISERGNLVLYATHSIFLIDRNKFDRHIILKKDKENTILQPSNVGRVGYFMQEEVLYRTLDTKLDSDFSFANEVNFVFEGDGDVALYAHYYENILAKDENRPFPFKMTSFHQGGKCSDIKKYFTQRPIQLGTKWVFVLDKDSAGDDLRKFIEGRYKKYLESDIFVFQYANENKNKNEVELEDLLSELFICETYVETGNKLGLNLSLNEIKKHITNDTLFVKYDEIINKSLIKTEKNNEFKVKFKETLNEKIRKGITAAKDENTFKKIFPEYHKWVGEIMPKLSQKN